MPTGTMPQAGNAVTPKNGDCCKRRGFLTNFAGR